MSIKIEPIKNGKTIMKYIGKKSESRKFYKNLKIDQNDTIFACDKFFRQDELFVKGKDVVHSGYRRYSVEDIPADESVTTFAKDRVHLFSQLKPFIELKNNPCVFLYKDKRYFSMDKIYEANVSNKVHDMIDQKFECGFTPEQTLNVYYSGIINGTIRENLIKPAFKMIKKGYPTEYVVKLMEHSKLRRATGNQKYSNGMLEFLEQFPYMRNNMVSVNTIGEEIFDSVGAHYFPKIFSNSENEIEALKILRYCRIKHEDRTVMTDERLALCALEILNNNGGNFTKSDYKLMANLASADHVYNARIKAVYPKLRSGVDSDTILKEYFNGRFVLKTNK